MSYVPIGCEILFFTDAAVKIRTEKDEHWVPLSLCEEQPEYGDVEIYVQEWFADKEGIE